MKKQANHTSENQRFVNLEKYQSINPEEDWDVVKDKIGFRKSRNINTLWRAAAIAILFLGVGFLARQYITNPPATIIAKTSNEQKKIILPDGSMVFLNQHSALTYPERFNRTNRQVSLSGEGFFEVARDPLKPFKVNVANRANVEVLGTSFNIDAAANGENVRVQVIEGKVAFSSSGNPGQREILEKEDQAEMNNGIITKNGKKDLNFLSWKTGIIYFEQEKITRVVEILCNHYGQEIILEDSVDKQLTFTSTIDNQDLESVLDEMSLVLGVSHSLVENRITIHISQ